VFCELLKDPDWPEPTPPVLRLSRVFRCTETNPTVSSTLAALLLAIFGSTSQSLRSLLPIDAVHCQGQSAQHANSGAQGAARVDDVVADQKAAAAETVCRSASWSRSLFSLKVPCLDPITTSFSRTKFLIFTFDYVGKSAAPAFATTIVLSGSYVYKRRADDPRLRIGVPTIPEAMALNDPSLDTFLRMASQVEGFLSCSRRAVGSTSTVLQLHGTHVLAKWFGPSEGHPDPERAADQWRTDFDIERQVYETALRPLWGSVVPRYLGAFEPASGKPTHAFLLLEDAGQPIVETHDFQDVPLVTR
jgi:hypothetical protein